MQVVLREKMIFRKWSMGFCLIGVLYVKKRQTKRGPTGADSAPVGLICIVHPLPLLTTREICVPLLTVFPLSTLWAITVPGGSSEVI